MNELLALADYRCEVNRLYQDVRQILDDGDAPGAHREWRERRDDLWRHHPSSPVPVDQRDDWPGLRYWDYDARYAFTAPFDGVAPLEGRDVPENTVVLPGHRAPWGEAFPAGVLPTPLGDLFLIWLVQYGGGMFLAFRDETNGTETYNGGRYLLDAPKGAWLGLEEDEIRIDLNFAYHPSCARSPEWNCPLALDPPIKAVKAGEKLETPAWG